MLKGMDIIYKNPIIGKVSHGSTINAMVNNAARSSVGTTNSFFLMASFLTEKVGMRLIIRIAIIDT